MLGVLLISFHSNAQKLKQQDLYGKWHLHKLVTNGEVIAKEGDTKLCVQQAYDKSLRYKKTLSAEDSAFIIESCKRVNDDMKNITIQFFPDGSFETTKFRASRSIAKNETQKGIYTFNPKTSVLVTTEGNVTADAKVTLKNGILRIKIETEYQEQTMEWIK